MAYLFLVPELISFSLKHNFSQITHMPTWTGCSSGTERAVWKQCKPHMLVVRLAGEDQAREIRVFRCSLVPSS